MKSKKNNTINFDNIKNMSKLSDILDSLNYLISESKSAKGTKRLTAQRDEIAVQLGLKYPTMATKRIKSQLQTA